MHDTLQTLLIEGTVARCERAHEPGASYGGIVVGVTSELVVLQQVDDAYRIDGYAALRPDELDTIGPHAQAAAIARVLAARGHRAHAPRSALSDLAALLQDCAADGRLVVIHDDDPNVVWVGTVQRHTPGDPVLLAQVGPDGAPSATMALTVDDITMVEWDTGYLDAIRIMAETRPDAAG